VEQHGETFTLNEFPLLRLTQPIEHFVDEKSLPDTARFADINVRERRGDVTATVQELSQRERCSVKV
jgi:hypothetical protein